MGFNKGVTLETILEDSKLSKLFLDFVLKTQSQDNLEFYIEVEMYKRISDGLQLQKMGKRLYHTYLAVGSELEVNLEKKYKDAVKQKMDMDFWDTSLFDKAQQRIHHILSSDCVMVFAERCLASDGYPMHPPKHDNPKARLTLVKHLVQYREYRRMEKANSAQFDMMYISECNCLSWRDIWPSMSFRTEVQVS